MSSQGKKFKTLKSLSACWDNHYFHSSSDTMRIIGRPLLSTRKIIRYKMDFIFGYPEQVFVQND